VYDEKPWRVVKGRRSPEIKWNRKTIRLPKETDGATVTQKQIETFIQAVVKPKKKKTKTKKKTTAKKK
jgi:topoisomerase IA-like protein